MEGIMLVCALFGALSVFIGLARIVAWVLDRREEAQTRVIEQTVYALQASAEVRRG